jgi:hypothetical protein
VCAGSQNSDHVLFPRVQVKTNNDARLFSGRQSAGMHVVRHAYARCRFA